MSLISTKNILILSSYTTTWCLTIFSPSKFYNNFFFHFSELHSHLYYVATTYGENFRDVKWVFRLKIQSTLRKLLNLTYFIYLKTIKILYSAVFPLPALYSVFFKISNSKHTILHKTLSLRNGNRYSTVLLETIQ